MTNNNKLIGCMLISFLISSVDALASLPYIGPNNKSCSVNVPTEDHIKDLDSGYLVSEDCNTIYVKPPIKGKIEDQYLSKTQLAHFCSSHNHFIKVANELYQAETSNIIEKENLKKLYSDAKDIKELKEIDKQIEEKLSIIKFLYQQLREIEETIKVTNGQNDVAATLTANLVLDNSSIVDAYKKINKDKVVLPMPISVGVLTGNLKTPDSMKNHQNLSIFQKLNVNPVVSSRIGGLKISDIISDQKKNNLDSFVPKFVSNLNGDARLMGQVNNISVELNNFGFCAIEKLYEKNKEKQISNSLYSYIAPTYTYFYPVQTKAVYKLEINKNNLFNKIYKHIQDNGKTLSSREAFDVIEKNDPSNTIKVTTNPGLFGDNDIAEDMRREYEEAMKKMIIDEIFSRLSSQIEVVRDEATKTITTTKIGENCRKKRFLFFSKTICSNYHYTVTEDILDEKVFHERIKDIVLRGGSAKANRYINHIMFDTVVFSSN